MSLVNNLLIIASLFFLACLLFGTIFYFWSKKIKTAHQLLSSVLKKQEILTNCLVFLTEHNQNLEITNREFQQEILSNKVAFKTNHFMSQHNMLNNFSQHDSVTHLPMRAFFNESLNKAITAAKRRHKILAIMIVDVSKEAIDKELKDIADRLSKTLRAEDVLAKLEGNEFIILLNDIGKAKFASTVAEKILQKVTSNAHIGISIYPTDGESLESLLSNAYTAIEAVKLTGTNGYQFYTKSIDIEGHEYIQLENALRKAISNNELSLHYQPKLHIKRGTITGVEALLRWTHPQFGNVSPSVFIPLAEDTNLIIPLTLWTLTEACKANKRWQAEGYEHLTVSVNLSTKQFYHPEICQTIRQVLNETGLSPDYLELEITENIVMNDIEKSTTILNNIKACGVHISIDHFGIGYTSISHLKQFPISAIKIDQSFIKGLPNIPNDISIVNAFIALAQNLGLLVVAEGVETAEQVEYLANQSCDMVQGYYLSQPVSEDKIVLQFKKIAEEVLVLL